MKDLKLVGIQELSAVEMDKLNGGCFWCGVGKVVNNIIRPVTGEALAVGGIITANPAVVAIGVALAVTK